MKITHKSSYPKMVKDKKTGSQKSVVMHVYRVTNASETEIALYKSLKGDYYKADDDGTPLYWSTKFVEGSAELAFTQNNESVYIKDDNDLRMKAIAQNFGVDIKDHVGQLLAQQALSAFGFASTPVATAPQVPQQVPQQPAEVEEGDDPFADEDGEAPF